MKNNKGLTLVELLGVLVVLSVVVAIISPLVTRELKKSKIQICENELDSFVTASKNWLTDQIYNNYKQVYDENGIFKETMVCVSELYNGGYITEYDEKYSSVCVYISKPESSYVYNLYEVTDVGGKEVKKEYKCK